jgi:hypothetical protein
MSRRRRPPSARECPTPIDERPVAERPTVDVVCTNRGQHRPVLLTKLLTAAHTVTEETVRMLARLSSDGLPPIGRTVSVMPTTSSHRCPTLPDPRRRGPTSHYNGSATHHFPCPKCNRTPRLREDRLGAICERLYETDPGKLRYCLDVSYAD